MICAAIEQALEAVRGCAITDAGRVGDLKMFGLGRELIATVGPARIVWEFSIHVRCPWRIVTSDDLVLVSKADIARRPRPDEGPTDGSVSRCDVLCAQLLSATPLRVQAVETSDELVTLELRDDLALQVHVDDEDEEQWRLLVRPAQTDSRHFVVTRVAGTLLTNWE